MKLLLTSAGIRNESLKGALLKLVGKPVEEASVVFIPTASDIENGDKDWLLDDIERFRAVGAWKQFDIVDIAAVEKNFWESRIREADVLYVGGGNEYFLMHHIENSGLKELLPELLKTKVWVGVSAGSMVLGKKFESEFARVIKDEDFVPPYDKVEAFLNYFDFSIKPHLNSDYFPSATAENMEKNLGLHPGPIYAIDDQTAICIDGDKLEVVSEGTWRKFN
jgi:dipeptidase E